MVEIYNIDYNKYIELIGTAHFTRRSLRDAWKAIEANKPKDVALELDWRRFRSLNAVCIGCLHRGTCKGICEFTGAANALGNINANIWLIDMSEREMKIRMTPFVQNRRYFPRYRQRHEDPIRLWEKGFKNRVIQNSKKEIEINRRLNPSVWRVLIDERNAIMAARLSWIVSTSLTEEKEPYILTLIGAAHVEGVTELLNNPNLIRENLQRYHIPFTEPTLVRRIAVQSA